MKLYINIPELGVYSFHYNRWMSMKFKNVTRIDRLYLDYIDSVDREDILDSFGNNSKVASEIFLGSYERAVKGTLISYWDYISVYRRNRPKDTSMAIRVSYYFSELPVLINLESIDVSLVFPGKDRNKTNLNLHAINEYIGSKEFRDKLFDILSEEKDSCPPSALCFPSRGKSFISGRWSRAVKDLIEGNPDKFRIP
jgi:hypothetical protein